MKKLLISLMILCSFGLQAQQDVTGTWRSADGWKAEFIQDGIHVYAILNVSNFKHFIMATINGNQIRGTILRYDVNNNCNTAMDGTWTLSGNNSMQLTWKDLDGRCDLGLNQTGTDAPLTRVSRPSELPMNGFGGSRFDPNSDATGSWGDADWIQLGTLVYFINNNSGFKHYFMGSRNGNQITGTQTRINRSNGCLTEMNMTFTLTNANSMQYRAVARDGRCDLQLGWSESGTITRRGTNGTVPPAVQAGTYTLTNKNSNLCLAVRGATQNNGEEGTQWACDGNADKNWKIIDAGGGFYKLQNENSNHFLAVGAGSRDQGGRVVQYIDQGQEDILWRLIDIGDGYYKVQNKNSGLFLAIGAGSREQGANLVQWGDAGQEDVKWKLTQLVEVANWDFETGNYATWTKIGDAFNNLPTRGEPNLEFSNAWRQNVPLGGDYWRDLRGFSTANNGFQGNFWATSFVGEPFTEVLNVNRVNVEGDFHVGKIISKEFTINTNFISYLVSGKTTGRTCRVELACFDDGTIGKGFSYVRFEQRQLPTGKVVNWPITESVIYSTHQAENKNYISIPFANGGIRDFTKSYTIPELFGKDDLISDVFTRQSFQIPDSLKGKRARIVILDDDYGGHINVDDIRFENTLSGSPEVTLNTPLWGTVDMHTHPMSHLGFGRKIMHGLPDNPADQTDIAAVMGNCNPIHGGWGLDNTGGNYIRMAVLKMLDKRNPYNSGLDDSHNHNGFPLYPNHASITHQQMWHEWIERAFQGGLRVMVALAVNNSLLAEAVDGDSGYKKDKESADKQLDEMVAFVGRHPFMRIARSASELRTIVSQGRLAVILGIELDNFGDFNDPTKLVNENTVREEIRRLFVEKGVRYIFPIHFADTKFGGCAVYGQSNITNIASHFTQSFVNITATPPEVIANIPGLKYQVETAPDSRITYRLTNPLSAILDETRFPVNLSLMGIRGILEGLEASANPCLANPFCAGLTGINMFCPTLRCALSEKSEYRIVKNFMLAPSSQYDDYALTSGGHRNRKNITTLGIFAIKEMMRLGMIIDIDHMSEKTATDVIGIANTNSYPINSGHTGFRGNGGDSENTRTDEHLDSIRLSRGMMGIGIAGSISPNFLTNYRYGMPRLRGIAIGSDINGMEAMPYPRFNLNGTLIQGGSTPELQAVYNYSNFSLDIRNRAASKVRYTNTTEGTNVALTMCSTRGKSWNYNIDGMAHVGLYPDFLQDLKNVGMSNMELSRFFMGAEYFAQMWAQCERQRTNIR